MAGHSLESTSHYAMAVRISRRRNALPAMACRLDFGRTRQAGASIMQVMAGLFLALPGLRTPEQREADIAMHVQAVAVV